MAAKKRIRKRASRAGKGNSKFRVNGSTEAKNIERQRNAAQANVDRGAQRAHGIEVAKLGPTPDPQAMLVADARAGDADAQWRADELYGSSWRLKKQRKVA